MIGLPSRTRTLVAAAVGCNGLAARYCPLAFSSLAELRGLFVAVPPHGLGQGLLVNVNQQHVFHDD